MSLLVLSNVLLWVFVAAQAVMLVAILRHLATTGAVSGSPAPRPAVGARPPTSLMKNLLGEALVLDDLEPQVHNIFFLSTTCRVCHQMLRALSGLRGVDYPAMDLFVIAGATNDVAAMAAQHGLDPAKVVPDGNGTISRSWGLVRRPFLVVLDDAGVIEASGRPEAQQQLRELLNRYTPGLEEPAWSST